MKPSNKDEGIDAFIMKSFDIDRKDSIKHDYCISKPIGCGALATVFKDALSKREYAISGLCQQCQDRIFD